MLSFRFYFATIFKEFIKLSPTLLQAADSKIKTKNYGKYWHISFQLGPILKISRYFNERLIKINMYKKLLIKNYSIFSYFHCYYDCYFVFYILPLVWNTVKNLFSVNPFRKLSHFTSSNTRSSGNYPNSATTLFAVLTSVPYISFLCCFYRIINTTRGLNNAKPCTAVLGINDCVF